MKNYYFVAGPFQQELEECAAFLGTAHKVGDGFVVASEISEAEAMKLANQWSCDICYAAPEDIAS